MRLIDADAMRESIRVEVQGAESLALKHELQKWVDDQPTVCDWISVKDRLPEQYEKTFRGILARNGEEIVKTRIVSDEVLVSYLNKYGRRKIGISYMLDGEWSGMFRSLAEIDVFTKAITHWQPLPEMPEEEENNG